jgi:hypothetical protein
VIVFNLIVLAITLLMAGFLLVWACFPRLRPWFEAPKYRILTWKERYPEAARPAVDGERPARSTSANQASGER